MSFDIKRFQKWDWGVVGAFILTIIGVSIPWWHLKMPDLGGLGDLGDLVGGALGSAGVSANANGWDFSVGQAAFAFMLIAVLWVLVKAFFRPGTPTPGWYKESWPIMGIGALCVIFGIVACADAPFGGFDAWSWRPGSIIALIAGVALLAFGYFMFKDRTGAYDGLGKFALPGTGGQQRPPAGYQPPAAGRFCSNCGAPLGPQDTACKNCGKPA
jgi:hypothetical protein